MKKVTLEITYYFDDDVKYVSVLPDSTVVGFTTKPYYDPTCNEYIGCDEPLGQEYGLYSENIPREDEDKTRLYEVTESGPVEIFDAPELAEFNYRDAYRTGDLVGEDGVPLTEEQFLAGLKKHFGVEFK